MRVVVVVVVVVVATTVHAPGEGDAFLDTRHASLHLNSFLFLLTS